MAVAFICGTLAAGSTKVIRSTCCDVAATSCTWRCVARNKRTPVWTPKYCNPYYWDLHNGTPDFRKWLWALHPDPLKDPIHGTSPSMNPVLHRKGAPFFGSFRGAGYRGSIGAVTLHVLIHHKARSSSSLSD